MHCKSILVVEDNADIRDTLEQVLQMEGYEVECASNGGEAIELLKRKHEPVLVLLDMMMPVMSGWEFLEAQKSDHVLATLPLVILSPLGAASALISKETPLPAVGYIKKPIALNALMEIVQQYCGTGDERISQQAFMASA